MLTLLEGGIRQRRKADHYMRSSSLIDQNSMRAGTSSFTNTSFYVVLLERGEGIRSEQELGIVMETWPANFV